MTTRLKPLSEAFDGDSTSARAGSRKPLRIISCPSFDRAKSLNSRAAFGCGARAAICNGFTCTTTGSSESLHRRAFLRHPGNPRSIGHDQGILSSRRELHPLVVAPFDHGILRGKPLQIIDCFLFPPSLAKTDENRVGVGVQRNFAVFPFSIEQRFVGPRRLFTLHQVGVHPQNIAIGMVRDPLTIPTDHRFIIGFAFGRPIGDDELSFHQRGIHLAAAGQHIPGVPARKRLGENPIEQGSPPGTEEFGLDRWIFFFKALEYPLAQIDVRRRPPNQFASFSAPG